MEIKHIIHTYVDITNIIKPILDEAYTDEKNKNSFMVLYINKTILKLTMSNFNTAFVQLQINVAAKIMDALQKANISFEAFFKNDEFYIELHKE